MFLQNIMTLKPLWNFSWYMLCKRQTITALFLVFYLRMFCIIFLFWVWNNQREDITGYNVGYLTLLVADTVYKSQKQAEDEAEQKPYISLKRCHEKQMYRIICIIWKAKNKKNKKPTGKNTVSHETDRHNNCLWSSHSLIIIRPCEIIKYKQYRFI